MTSLTSKRSVQLFLDALLLAVGTQVTGCDSDWPGSNKLVVVHGTVTLDHTPLAGARVTFIPITPIDSIDESLKPMAYAITDVHGDYSLNQADGMAGATTGQHTVIISKPINSSDDSKQTDAVPEFYREHGYLKRHVMPLPDSHQMDFMLYSVDPLLRE